MSEPNDRSRVPSLVFSDLADSAAFTKPLYHHEEHEGREARLLIYLKLTDIKIGSPISINVQSFWEGTQFMVRQPFVIFVPFVVK